VNCRFGTKREAPFEVAGRGTEKIICELATLRPGKFEGQMHVFLDDRGLREHVVMVRGETKGEASE
jgi:hypothetical protein